MCNSVLIHALTASQPLSYTDKNIGATLQTRDLANSQVRKLFYDFFLKKNYSMMMMMTVFILTKFYNDDDDPCIIKFQRPT